MKRILVLIMVSALLMAPSFGAANPNGVGDGTFDAQCGGACHGDADMNRTSASTVTLEMASVVYEGLLTSVSVTVTDVQTTSSGMLGVFLLSDVSGSGDALPAVRVPATQTTARLRLKTSQMISAADSTATIKIAPLIAACAKKNSLSRSACVYASPLANRSTATIMIRGM